MKKILRILLIAVAVLAVALAGGSLYLLSYSLRPERTIRAKNAASYEYMYAEYPFLRPWVDSLERAGALHDTVIRRADGVRLHALYAAAPHPTDRTAVIVHGYTDNAVRMLMIGYLYNHDLGYNILLPDLCYHGRSEGGGRTASTCCAGRRSPTASSGAIRGRSCTASRWGPRRR